MAAIPEGLPAVVTVALALGVQRMARRGALVRHLPSVETLGCAQVICTDKTGTLTLGEMTARRLVTATATYTVTGEGYGSQGGFFVDGVERTAAEDPPLLDLLRAAAGCNAAELTQTDGLPVLVGDPTEGALLVAAAKGGIHRGDIESRMPRLTTLPFDPNRKRMTVIHEREGRPWAFVKGAPEVVIERCSRIRTEGGVMALAEGERTGMLRACAVLASDALRVLAVAERPLDAWRRGDGTTTDGATAVEQDLTLLGLIGLQDPPRPEARDAVKRCREAGIRTVMLHELNRLLRGEKVSGRTTAPRHPRGREERRRPHAEVRAESNVDRHQRSPGPAGAPGAGGDR